MKIVAIIQARMGSTRLPGKVMKSLCGHSVLAHVIYRARACHLVDEVVVATTTAPADDLIEAECRRVGATVFRGSEEDVLARYYHAACTVDADVVVRITSDCPLFDPQVLEEMLSRFLGGGGDVDFPDYFSNTLTRTYPRGLDAEIFTFAALERAFDEAEEPFEREHVTPYFYQQPDLFSTDGLTNDRDWSEYRWTLDAEDDWTLIEEIYTRLFSPGRLFTTGEVVALMDRHPELVLLNAHVEQKKLGE